MFVHFRLFFLLLISCPLYAQGDQLPLSEIMTNQEMQELGLQNASPQQKQAFEQWIARWTHRVLEQAPSYRSGEPLSSWVQRWPSFANPTKTEPTQEDVLARQQSNQRIDKIRNNGEIIELKDGSSWKISPFYRYLTTLWQRNQVVEIKQSANSLHPYVLHNITLDQIAQANMVTSSSPTGQKPLENPEEFKGSVILTKAPVEGGYLELSDGSTWKVAPADMYRARTWHPSDRVKVQPSDKFLYKYTLTNLDSGEVIFANPKK